MTAHLTPPAEQLARQRVIAYYYPDDGHKVISSAPAFIKERREACGRAIPLGFINGDGLPQGEL